VNIRPDDPDLRLGARVGDQGDLRPIRGEPDHADVLEAQIILKARRADAGSNEAEKAAERED
jgi:hypothetical protein